MENIKNHKPGSGNTQVLAVDKFGVASNILKMYKEGVSAANMSKELKEKGIEISDNSILKWISRNKIRLEENRKIMGRNTKRFEMMCVNYQTEITNILDEVKEVKKEARKSKNIDAYVKLVGKLYQGLELLAKLMGDIKPSGAVDIKIIINEINKGSFIQNKNKKNKLFDHTNIVFDAEAEIVETDITKSKELRGESK